MSLTLVQSLSLLPLTLLGQTEAPSAPTAPPPAAAAAPALTLEGGADFFYAHNFNRPADQANFLPGTGTSAQRANAFGLNLASLGVSLAPEPVGFKALVGVGSSLAVVHAGEPGGTAAGPDVWYPLQEASVSWAVSDALLLRAGAYLSHIGLEVLQSQANWTYTRSWMGELSLYYQAGVMAAYRLDEHWSVHLHLLNGWQNISDNNSTPALGTRLEYASERVGVSFNTFIGEEPVGETQGLRLFGDVVATLKVTERLQLAASVDAALQQRPDLPDAHWWAAGLNARYQLSKPLAIAARAEVFDDLDGAISGTAQRLAEATLTLEARPVEHLVLKLEGRYDTSTADVFSSDTLASDGTPVRTDSQALVLLGTTVYF